MSRWTHPICETCYDKKYPGAVPFGLTIEYREVEQCCFCLGLTFAGIYVRHDPDEIMCKGEHGADGQ